MTAADPGTGASAVTRVMLLLDANRPQDAMQAAREGLRSDPSDATLMALMGRASFAQGDAQGARAWAERALSLTPDTAWIHDLRARAILDGAGNPAEAFAAASAAIHADPEGDSYWFTFARACLENGDRRGAEQAVELLRESSPDSVLGPLAEALVELDRGRVYFQRRISPLRLAVLAVITQGTGLVLLGIWWVIHAVRRTPHLRRADALLHEALEMNPGAASIQVLAAHVLNLRFRFAQAVDYELAAAAIESGLVDADALARTISRRTTTLAVLSLLIWVMTVALLDRPIESDALVALVAVGMAVVFVIAGFVFDRWQTRGLPALLLRNVRSRWPLPAVVCVAAVWVVLAGVSYPIDPQQPARGYHLASLVIAPLIVAFAVALVVRFLAAQRTP